MVKISKNLAERRFRQATRTPKSREDNSNAMKQRNEETIGLVMVTAVMVYWGITTILQKHALLYMSSTTYIMLRFLIAALLILPVYWNQLRKSATKSTVRHGCILGFLQLIPMEASVFCA